jgi:hypothetical protein
MGTVSRPHQHGEDGGLHPQRLDWTKRFSVIAGALDIPGEAIIDGEVVVTHEGRTNFSELQPELAAGSAGQVGLLCLRPSVA